MEGSYSEKYSFIGEWYDSQASLLRRFNIFWYPTDNSVEMYDIRNRKKFVRRVKIPGIQLENFYIGCTINILGRLVKIVDFACEHTRRKLLKDVEITFALIKPLPINIVGKVLTHLNDSGLRFSKIRKVTLSSDDVNYIYRAQLTTPSFPFTLEYLSGNQVYLLELVGRDAVEVAKKVVGNSDPTKAEPGTIRALYGSDIVKNTIHISPSLEIATEDRKYAFPSEPIAGRMPLTATLSNCTLCIVKPTTIRDGQLGRVLEAIHEGGFEVTACNMLLVENINAEEFYEVYKGIVPEYKGMVEELASGPCVAMEIVSKDPALNSAIEFRKFVGPADPEIARLLRPHTLRAKFGKSKVKNAIHCSDLPEDGLLEVEYFFKILDM